MRDGKFICDSTSFHVGFLIKDAPRPEDRLYNMFLVTNRHDWMAGIGHVLASIWVTGKFNNQRNPLKLKNEENLWLAHKDPAVGSQGCESGIL